MRSAGARRILLTFPVSLPALKSTCRALFFFRTLGGYGGMSILETSAFFPALGFLCVFGVRLPAFGMLACGGLSSFAPLSSFRDVSRGVPSSIEGTDATGSSAAVGHEISLTGDAGAGVVSSTCIKSIGSFPSWRRSLASSKSLKICWWAAPPPLVEDPSLGASPARSPGRYSASTSCKSSSDLLRTLQESCICWESAPFTIPNSLLKTQGACTK
mmetsp:Transcript_8052/g.30232  ORF Transcript_8052/g.30232 Transcript_8052/m.30232 type:complete len:215 (-) Transcript_8052:1015-1659(-)